MSTVGLAVGSYSGTITVSATGASNTPQTVPVSLTVTQPTISLSPTSFTFTGVAGGANPSSKTLTISSTGTLSWTASDNATWLTVSPASGSASPSAPSIVTVSVSTVGLAVGSYSGTITVSATGASNTPQTVPVSLVTFDSLATLRVLFDSIEVHADGDATGNGELYWSFTMWSPSTGTLIIDDEHDTAAKALSVASNTTYIFGKSREFTLANVNGNYFSISFHFWEDDVFADDDLGGYGRQYTFNGASWGGVERGEEQLGEWLLSGNEASVTVHWTVERID